MKKRPIIPEYFAGSFTGEGFTNFLPDATKGAEKIYIIKGTPGSGKSTLMKKIASAAEDVGESVERIYCSSDPFSLDGVVIPSLSFVIVDGTSPHVMESSYPIAVETIINTGDYISSEKLEEKKEDIILLSDQKKSLFNQAGTLLRAVTALNTLKNRLLEECYDSAKGFKFCMNIIQKEKSQKSEGTILRRSCIAFGKNGISQLKSFVEAEKTYLINEAFAPFILGTLKLLSEEYGLSSVWAPSPIDTQETAALYFPFSKRLFISSKWGKIGENVSASRFEKSPFLKQYREKKNFLSKTEALILSEAQSYISEAMQRHKELEEIYVSALNKDGLDCLAQSITLSIFGEK